MISRLFLKDIEIETKIINESKVLTLDDINRIHQKEEGETQRIYAELHLKLKYGVDVFDVTPAVERIFGKVKYEEIRNMKQNGYVYIAKDPDNGLIKIGRTIGKVEYRIGALNCGRSNHIVQYNSFYCKNCIEAENLAHKELKEKRLVGEWFEITYDLANSVVKKITGEINEKYDPLINYRKGDIPSYYFTETGYEKLTNKYDSAEDKKVKKEVIDNYYHNSSIRITVSNTKIPLTKEAEKRYLVIMFKIDMVCSFYRTQKEVFVRYLRKEIIQRCKEDKIADIVKNIDLEKILQLAMERREEVAENILDELLERAGYGE